MAKNSDYTILTVDDSPSIRAMLAYTLNEAGYQTEGAENGAEALKKASANKYDLVIMDINMPVMNGIEAIGKLRQMADYRHAPILVLSTESHSALKQQGKEAGATGWIVKPFDPDILIKAMKRLLH